MASQCKQDLWVLSFFKKGKFVDIGCNDGEYLSNTYLLEKSGWSGLCIDPFPKNFKNRPNTILEYSAVYKYSSSAIEFYNAGMWGGIKETQKNKTVQEKYKAGITKTQTLEYFLQKHNFPEKIEYLSIDTEGSEYEILSVFPFNKYKFGCITCEFNEKRKELRELLELNEYVFDCTLGGIDDCFIHKDVKNESF